MPPLIRNPRSIQSRKNSLNRCGSLPEGTDAAVRVYRCSACHREMRLTVWAAIAPQTEECFFSV
jgi:hypothetical protein